MTDEDPEVLAFIENFKKQLLVRIGELLRETMSAVPKVPYTETGRMIVENETIHYLKTRSK